MIIYNHMVVDYQDQTNVDGVFRALADSTRRDILKHSLESELSVSTLARRYPMSFAAVQKHVAVLERARLITKQRHGREQLVRGNVDVVASVVTLLDEFESVWRHRLVKIDQILAEGRDEGEEQ